jgi:hypothetical protein
VKLIKNTGSDRVAEELKAALREGAAFDLVSPNLPLFAFGELYSSLSTIGHARLLLSPIALQSDVLLGNASERPFRNRLSAFANARRAAGGLRSSFELCQEVLPNIKNLGLAIGIELGETPVTTRPGDTPPLCPVSSGRRLL